MKSTKIASDAGSETRVVILDSGGEAFATLTKFANDNGREARQPGRLVQTVITLRQQYRPAGTTDGRKPHAERVPAGRQ